MRDTYENLSGTPSVLYNRKAYAYSSLLSIEDELGGILWLGYVLDFFDTVNGIHQ